MKPTSKVTSILTYSACFAILITVMINPVLAFCLAVFMILGMSSYHQYMV